MLIKCPECELQVSDKAFNCPHCGYPMQTESKIRKPRVKNNKRRRLPNGFGQISEIKGRNLRNPFRAMISIGKTETGRPICKPLKPESYFPTYNDAYAALVEYNRNPYDISGDITVGELFERWMTHHEKTLNSDSSVRSIKNAWKYCNIVSSVRAVDIRARHIKSCFENPILVRGVEKQPSAAVQNVIKSLFNQMLDYALEYELVDKNYSRTFKLDEDVCKEISDVKNEHIPYTDDEIATLWKNTNNPTVSTILIQCYSGWRPQELGLLRLENIDLESKTMCGGMKTEAGYKRTVPIHPKILHLIETHYKFANIVNSPYLFNPINKKGELTSKGMSYYQFYSKLKVVCSELKLNMEHRPHDGRKHFVTAAKNAKLDEYAIKYIVGHKISDITEKVYTQRERQWLREEIEKIK